jgi:hypothetical protein
VDVRNLSREQKLALLAAAEEKARRKKRSKAAFKPNAGQDPVLRSKALIRLVTSGNGAGKTTMAVVEAGWTAQGFNPLTGEHSIVPTKIIYLLDRPSKVNDKVIPELKKFFDTSGWGFHKDGTPAYRRISLPNGSEILFYFHEMEAMAFESIDGYSLVIADEPPPRHAYIGLRRGGRSKGFKTRFLLIGTPIGPNSSWLRMEILEAWKNGDPDIEVFNFHTDVNAANLDDGYIDNFSKALTDKEKAIRLRGEWSDLDGLALAHLFKEQVHVVANEPPGFYGGNNPCVVAIDPHPSKNHVAILLGADRDDQLYVLKELSLKMVPRLFAKELRKWMAGYRVIDIVCDNLGSSEMTGGEGFKSFISVLQEEGVRVRPTSYDEKVDAEWITRLQTALLIPTDPNNFGQCVPKLRFLHHCRQSISDIKNVAWQKVKNVDEYKPTLEISNKDALSCLKYALAANLFYAKPHKTKPMRVAGSMYGVTAPAKDRIRRRLSARMRPGRR